MMRKYILMNIALGFIFISFNSSKKTNANKSNYTSKNNQERKVETPIDFNITNDTLIDVKELINTKSIEFVKNLKAGKKVSLFFNTYWTFVYHSDNRADGSTDGKIENLKSNDIDSILNLQVKNDGIGWFKKKEAKTHTINFDIKKEIADWDRFEIPNYENKEKNIVYVVGSGESDYLKLHYNDNGLIIQLEYRSEDPG